MDAQPLEGGGDTPNLQINRSSFKPPSDPTLTSSQSTLTLTPVKSLTSMRSSPSIGLGKGGRVVKAAKPDFLRKATLKTCHEKGIFFIE